MALDTSHGTVVLVEQSDSRLAAVEEAKRTGKPLESVGANVSVPVPASTAINIADDHLKDETYTTDRGTTFPAHFEDIHDKSHDEAAIQKTNEQKAAEHEAYSAELARARIAEEEKLAQKMKNGYKPDEAIQVSNVQRAAAYEKEQADWVRQRDADQANVKPAIDVHNAVVDATKDLDTIDDRAIADQLKDVNPAPDASESATKEALQTKDLIISGDKSFADEVSSPKKTLAYDHPGTAVKQSTIEEAKKQDVIEPTGPAENAPAVETQPVPVTSL